jgi:hypothetical protein
MDALPFRLALDAVLPARAPSAGEGTLNYGFRLRLPDGPAIDYDDPLLAAFGAQVDDLIVGDHEALQLDVFDPGRRLVLVSEPYGPDVAGEVGVWDAEEVRRVGTLADDLESTVLAALDQGLPLEALVLREERTAADDRRGAIELLVFSPLMMQIGAPPTPRLERPSRRVRQRLVLFVGETGDLRWWDPAAGSGPVDLDDLPMSVELSDAFGDLQRAYESFATRSVAAGAEDGFEQMERIFARQALDGEARRLWMRARLELGRRYDVGFHGPEMQHPIWTPSEDEDDDDIEF